jgi:hypothetical protein
MPDSAYLGQGTDVILGQEFLTWLWYICETRPEAFADADGQPFTVAMERRIVVQGGEGESLETTSVAGALSQLREARLGLSMGKKVTRAQLRIEDSQALVWQVTLNAGDLAPTSFRAPPLDREDSDHDPDALFLEKMYLVESGLQKLDATYRAFLALRLSSRWPEEVRAVARWMARMD